MMNDLILAFDFGTSGVKSCIFDTKGNFLAEGYDTYQTHYPQAGYVEHDPNDWWEAMKTATRKVLAASGIQPAQIKATSFSAHGMGVIPVDADGNVLTERVMLWNDIRATEEAKLLLESIGERERYEMTGTSFDLSMQPAAKILWIKRNQPEVFAKTAKFLSPKEYLIQRMTGIFGFTDYSIAGTTGLYNLREHRWDPKLLALSGIDESHLCKVVDGTHLMGGLTSAAAAEMGLCEGTAVVLGSWDNYACATGGGVRKKGEMVLCMGTAGWMAVNHDTPIMTPDNMTNVVYVGNNTYFTSIHTHAACAAYDWVINNACTYLKSEKNPLKAAEELAKAVPVGSDKLFFLPSMFAGNTFYSSSALCGTFVGLKMLQGTGHLIRAAMEGVGFDLMMGAELMQSQNALPANCCLIGGGAKSNLWRQILADMCQVTMTSPNNMQHIGAFGAALMAGVGTGLIENFDKATDIVKTDDKAVPIAENTNIYKALLPVYRKFYEQLLPAYKMLQDVKI